MTNTPNLDLPLLYENQSQKSVTINQAFTILDRVTQLSVTSRTNVVPTPTTDGEAYLVTAGATGAWLSQTNNIAVWNATGSYWSFIAPHNGWMTWVSAEATHYIYNVGVWLLLNDTLLDAIGDTQGNILYRNASGWVALAPGTAGLFLRTNGASANPSWASTAASRGTFTLTASATTTTVTDANCTATSIIVPRATTENAALAIPLMYIVEGSGSFVVHHANNSQVDRTFKYVIE